MCGPLVPIFETVIDMGKAYIRGAKEEGVATSVKHFPGDGVDANDELAFLCKCELSFLQRMG